MTKIKTLCLCAGGTVRSVTLSSLLRYCWKHDAIAASLDTNTDSTLKMLYEWADHVYVVQPYMLDAVPAEYRYKTRVLDVGADNWGMSMHPELQDICYKLLEEDLGPDRRQKTWDEIKARRAERYNV